MTPGPMSTTAATDSSRPTLGKTQPPVGKPMSDTEADDIVAFIIQDIQGKPERPFLEECQRYYGKKPLCNMYAE